MLDVLIRNIDIADGSGNPIYRGSVAVKDGKIVKIASAVAEEAKTVIEGKDGWVLSPGFIDTHTHSDLLRLVDPTLNPQIVQGVTYDICGNCGISAAPIRPKTFDLLKKYVEPVLPIKGVDEEWSQMTTFSGYFESLKKRNPSIGMGALVGHGTLRIAVMGMDNREPTKEELEEMKAILREAMESGALGLSSGLIYIPGVYSKTEELVELCKVVAEYHGIYATHMRNEGAYVVESVKESIDIARKAGVRLIISHHKISGFENHDLYKETLGLIQKAREEGMNIICDQYLYNYGSTGMSALLPPACQSEGTDGMLKKLKNPAERAEIIQTMKTDLTYENFLKYLGADAVLVVSASETKEYNGKFMDEVARLMGKEPEDAVCELLVQNSGSVLMAVRMCEEDVVEEIFKFPYTCVGSDGIGAGTGQLTHPRAYGNFVRVFETYVRERHIVSLEEAVRKCTSLPADFIGLSTKGHIKEGYDADIVIFDRDKIGTDATFSNPITPPKGIAYVFVGGKLVVKDCKVI